MLKKALYGLKQSPKLWYQTFVDFMTTLGFVRLKKDRCVFVHQDSNYTMYAGLYVDDIIFIAPTREHIAKLKAALHARFQMTDLGPLTHLLGWEIERNRNCRSMFIRQTRYAGDCPFRVLSPSGCYAHGSTHQTHGCRLSYHTS